MYKSYDEFTKLLNKKNFQKRIDKLAKKYEGKKIIIYGAGILFDAITKNYDLSKLNIIGVADIKFDTGEEYQGFKAYDPEDLVETDFDVILISMYEPDNAEEFLEEQIIPEHKKFKYEPFLQNSIFDLLKELFLRS